LFAPTICALKISKVKIRAFYIYFWHFCETTI
jgi:hypothetical protein